VGKGFCRGPSVERLEPHGENANSWARNGSEVNAMLDSLKVVNLLLLTW
jgi:hypothetical protein